MNDETTVDCTAVSDQCPIRRSERVRDAYTSINVTIA